MAVLVSVVNGELAVNTDVNQLITAFLNQHANSANNEHLDSITLGSDASVDTARGIVANVLKGDTSGFPVQLYWEPALRGGAPTGGAWAVDEGDGVTQRLLLEDEAAGSSLRRLLTPKYGVSEITSGGSPTDSLGYDSLDLHLYEQLENTVDAADQTMQITITHELSAAFTDFVGIDLWSLVSTDVNASSAILTVVDTAGVAASYLAGGSAVQNTTWTKDTTVPDVGSGTWDPGGIITIIITLTASQTEYTQVGELVIQET